MRVVILRLVRHLKQAVSLLLAVPGCWLLLLQQLAVPPAWQQHQGVVSIQHAVMQH